MEGWPATPQASLKSNYMPKVRCQGASTTFGHKQAQQGTQEPLGHLAKRPPEKAGGKKGQVKEGEGSIGEADP